MELNSQQKHAVAHARTHVLVLAGAGTGKTRTIIARAAHLVQKGVHPNRILLLAFTRRAAKEMKDRLHHMIGESHRTLMAGTFHHFCLYTMRRLPKLFGLENITVIDRDDQIQLIKLIRGEFISKGEIFPRAAELVSLFSYARNTLQPIDAYLERYTEFEDDIKERMCRIFQAFDARKERNHYLDYDDILFKFAAQLHEVPEIGRYMRGLYDHILVDEMQDTNPLQWQILDGMRDPALLFCVGDDAQSIYAFRGADFRNVHAFTQRVPGSEVLRLEKNYRSTQGILDLSNWLLRQSSVSYGKHLRAHRKTVSKPVLMDFGSDFEEARWITDDLIERHANGTPWRDHMIITRTAHGARSVESFMVEKKVPYRFIGGISLLQAAHVKDLFSLVRATASPLDELAWARYLTLWPRIGDVTAARLIKEIKQLDRLEGVIDYLKGELKGRKEIIQGVCTVSEHWEDPAAAILAAGAFLTPLLKLRYNRWERRKRDFDLLARLSKDYRSLVVFLETYTLDPISATDARRREETDVVTLTTAHSAKGTESPVCYIIRVEPGMYPHVRSLGNRDQEEEERRILYVAMTRAIDELILTRTVAGYSRFRAPRHSRGLYSGRGFNPGRDSVYFLEDLVENLIETDGFGSQAQPFGDDDMMPPW